MTEPASGARIPGTFPVPGSRALASDPVRLVILVTTAAALLLRLYQLSRPGFLFGVIEYDDGTDFGSAVRLIGGALPYRDFVMVQPPGITLLMTPIAFLAKGLGTAGSLAVARVVTALASTAGVVLGGLLVRHRGLFATTVTCGVLAVFPDSVAAAKTVLLEPWLVLFCLAGALAVFDRDRLATGWRRLALGGLAFGFAGAVKVWAILPVAVIVLLLARRPRRAGVFAGAVAVGFLAPVLPFAALAPRSFYNSVVVAQLVRVDLVRVPLGERLTDMTGLVHTPSLALVAVVAALIVAVTAGSSLLATRLTGRGPAPLEWFALGTLAVVVAAFLWPADFYYHYAAFLAPFLGMAIGLPTARALAALPAPPAGRPMLATLLTTRAAVWAAAGLFAVFAIGQAAAESTMVTAIPPSAIATARHLIRPGACVLSDQMSFAMAADRFVPAGHPCSLMVDGVGTDYALSGGHNGLTGAESSPQVRAVWLAAFRDAQYVWLTSAANRRIPWTPQLQNYFITHFTPLAEGPDWIFVRTARRGG